MPETPSDTNPGTAPETFVLHGLEGPAEIRVDRWGIAHIEAGSLHDVFFLQGWNAARDRLWQIDLWRKRGLGLLAADFGPGYLAQDHAARHFLYRGDMDAEWAAYGDGTRDICAAFVAGINAWIALTRVEPDRLPPEFALLGTRPASWEPEDVVRIRSHALVHNALSEILRAQVLGRADAETDRLRADLEPPVDPGSLTGPDPRDVPLAACELYKLGTAPVSFEPARLQATLDEAPSWSRVTAQAEVVRRLADEGSNNWAVHGERTETGRPILASDPHRTQAVPSLRYLVHLRAPGLDVIGAGEPAVPGVSIGHNQDLAFGLTIFRADQEDVYVYETDPADPDRYRYGGGWESVVRVDERFAVKGCPDQHLALSFTRHGPILHQDHRRRRLVAIRSVWAEPGSAAYLGSLSYLRADTVDAFARSLSHWGSPAVNHVAADTKGDIGWFTAGLVPLRANWPGILPVPGDGRYEWQGFRDAAALPRAKNPAGGFVASANEMNLPKSFLAKGAPSIGHEWADGSRARRIRQTLSEQTRHGLADSAALQTDVLSLIAKRLCVCLENLPATGDTGAALRLLSGWNSCLTAQSAPAALFELWWMTHLRPGILGRFAPDPDLRRLLLPGDLDRLVVLIETPEPAWSTEDRDALLTRTLAAAWADCATRLGPDPAAWAWSRLHQALMRHAASPLRGNAEWDVGPHGVGGSQSTVMNMAYRPEDFSVTSGASVRLVMDVGDWDRSLCLNYPGQSGDPRSRHYADLAETWAASDHVPFLYSPDAISKATARLLRFKPATSPGRSAV